MKFSLLADLLLAHRLLYYVRRRPVLADHEYDELEKAAIENAPRDHPLHKPGSDREEDYPPSIRALAIYLQMRPKELERVIEAPVDFEIPDEPPGVVSPVKRKPGNKIIPDGSLF